MIPLAVTSNQAMIRRLRRSAREQERVLRCRRQRPKDSPSQRVEPDSRRQDMIHTEIPGAASPIKEITRIKGWVSLVRRIYPTLELALLSSTLTQWIKA